MNVRRRLYLHLSGLLSIGILLLGGCNAIQTLTNVSPPSLREQYVKRLDKSELSETTMVKSWLDAGNPDKTDSLTIVLPYQETGFFPSAEPQARFYRFEVKAGQVLTLTSLVKSQEPVTIFADVFIQSEGNWALINHADSTLRLSHEFDRNGTCLVRLQPELLINAFYSITLSVTPVLLNPVKGATNKSIGSFYGDQRDGGKRKHEGIDIFAPKGTPVVAPTSGLITRVSTGGLGGKIIWMNDTKRRHSYYFAHLDSQWVKSGIRVKQGDTLGTVGNTGNARYTPSHLHFGVYQRTSIDPIAYIRTMEKLVNELAPDTSFQSLAFKVRDKNTALHSSPALKSDVIEKFSRDSYVRVIAQSKDWFRAESAENRQGYIQKKKVIPADKGSQLLISETWLTVAPKNAATPIALLPSQKVEALAAYEGYRYVRTAAGQIGWIRIAP